MNNLFAYFTSDKAPVKFPGMPFIVGAIMMLGGIFFAIPSLRHYHRAKAAELAEQEEQAERQEATT
jgi:DHA1 family tetracycline resistance protein-like MFS transporter